MAWPNDRLTNYAPGVPVKSADLNEIQDSFIEVKHGEIETYFLGSDGRGDLVGTTPCVFGLQAATAADAANLWWQPLRLPVGSIITELECDYDRSPGGGTVKFGLWRQQWAAASGAELATITNAAAGSRAQMSVASGLPYTIASGYEHYLRFDFAAVGNVFYGGRMKWYRP